MRQRIFCPGCGTGLTKNFFETIEEDSSPPKYLTKCDSCEVNFIVQEFKKASND